MQNDGQIVDGEKGVQRRRLHPSAYRDGCCSPHPRQNLQGHQRQRRQERTQVSRNIQREFVSFVQFILILINLKCVPFFSPVGLPIQVESILQRRIHSDPRPVGVQKPQGSGRRQSQNDPHWRGSPLA